MLPNDTLRKLGLSATRDDDLLPSIIQEEAEPVEYPVFRLLRLNPR